MPATPNGLMVIQTISVNDLSDYDLRNHSVQPGQVWVVMDEDSRPIELVFGTGAAFQDSVRIKQRLWDLNVGIIEALQEAVEQLTDVIQSSNSSVTNIIRVTQAEYEATDPKSPTTVYLIAEEE